VDWEKSMILAMGIVLMLGAAACFVYSLPRDGKTARFVGGEWEGYAVVAMIGGVGIGILLIITATISLMNAA
jgi:hypothetical protein